MALCRRSAVLLVLFLALPIAAKQPPAITATAAGDTLRVVADAGVCAMRVQLVSAAGEVLSDSGWKDGNVVDWPALDGAARVVATMKDLDGETTQREFAVSSGETPKITLLAHDGENGSVVSTKGDLTFRFGDFLARRDSERMRLTAEGNLGIGTDVPQAKLDVRGRIRATEGIQFPDGSVLVTAVGLPGATRDVDRKSTSPAMRQINILPPARSTQKTLTPKATASDYQFKVDNGGVHVGTTLPFNLGVTGFATFNKTIELPQTADAITGVMKMGGEWYLHSYPVSTNTFLGTDAGNFFITGTSNTGVGYIAMNQLRAGSFNTALGTDALGSTSSGSRNTALGVDTLYNNDAGSDNTAVGNAALFKNNNSGNTAIGAEALFNSSSGLNNTSVGFESLFNNSAGSHNTAVGYQAMSANLNGGLNTAIGYFSLSGLTSGSSNIAIGENSGSFITNGSNNIEIGTTGGNDANTIRIGNANHSRAFLTGIYGTQVSGLSVVIDANGQLGTASSSRRYKTDIQDAGDSTDALMQLRPVTFRYRAQGAAAPLQYGLIAEEVEAIYPELVARNKDGQVESVMYQFLAPMLLNEVQKQHRQIESQQKAIDELTAIVNALRERLERQERRE